MPLSPSARNRREAAAAALAAGVLAAGGAAVDGAAPLYALLLAALAGGAAGSSAPGGGGERGARGRDAVWLAAAAAAGMASGSVVLAAGLALPAASALTRQGASPWWRAGVAAGALGAALAAALSADLAGAAQSVGSGAAAPWAVWALGAAWLTLRAGWEGGGAALRADQTRAKLASGGMPSMVTAGETAGEMAGEGAGEASGALETPSETTPSEALAGEGGQVAPDAEFLARAVHEIRNPLNAILTTLQILESRMFGPLPDKYADYVAIMGESGAYLQQLIQDVLDVSRIEAGSMPVTIERAEIAAVARDTIAAMRAGAKAKGVELRERDLEEPFWIMADARAVRQIAFNLLGNAVKFTPAGAAVTCSLSEEGDEAVLRVEDEGPGFPPEALARLGEAFVQGGGAAARQGGAGLGLSIVAALAARHGGSLRAANRPEGGSVVEARLPIRGPDHAPQEQQA